MKIEQPTPAHRIGRSWLTALGACFLVGWFVIHVAFYVYTTGKLDQAALHDSQPFLQHFFYWQLVGFLGAPFLLAVVRPAAAGRVLAVYLGLSTLGLWWLARDASFVILLLWGVCTVNSARLAIRRMIGPRFATWGVAAATAYAGLIPLCFLLGIAHALRVWPVAVSGVLLAIPGAWYGIREIRRAPPAVWRACRELTLVSVVSTQIIWCVLALSFVGASTTECQSDSCRVHLPYIHQLELDHGLSHQYACWHRLQPMAVQTCEAAFAVIGADPWAKWYSWLALAALVLLVIEEVHLRSGVPELAALAGAALLGCPLLPALSTRLYVDHLITLLCSAGFIVLFRALRPASLRGVLLSAGLMGCMVQIKYPGLNFAMVWGLMLLVLLLRRGDWRTAVRWSALAAVSAVIVALPWYVYVYAGTGNPFYPYLDRWFPSAYWARGFTLQSVFEAAFRLDPGIMGLLRFPWQATYDTGRFYESHPGFLGFWVLALAPAWFWWRRRHGSVAYGDLMVGGICMLACVLTYTPYVRYWLPAFPVILMSCFLASGRLVPPARWRPAHWWARAGVGVLLAVGLLWPVPLSLIGMGRALSWEEFTKQMPVKKRWEQLFVGVQAVERLNQIMRPDEGVICSGYGALHTIRGKAYEFAPWWNQIHHISDVASFTDFFTRNGVRYWVVDHQAAAVLRSVNDPAIFARYWTDSRLVAAWGTVAVYDLQADVAAEPTGRQLSMGIEAKPSWSPLEPTTGWLDLNLAATSNRLAAEGVLAVNAAGILGRHIDVTPGASLCKFEFSVHAAQPVYPFAVVLWYDAAGKEIDNVGGPLLNGSGDFQTWLYAPIPEGAKGGWLKFWPWGGQPLGLRSCVQKCWDPQRAVTAAQPATNSLVR